MCDQSHSSCPLPRAACTWEGMEGSEPGAWGGQALVIRGNVGSLSRNGSSKCSLARVRLSSLGEAGPWPRFPLWRLTFPTQRLGGAGGGRGRLRPSRAHLVLDSGRIPKLSLIEEDTETQTKGAQHVPGRRLWVMW